MTAPPAQASSTPPAGALVALGSNVAFGALAGAALLEAAMEALAARGLPTLARSSVWTTPAWPDPTDPPFANAVALLDPAGLEPEPLFAELAAVERAFGRIRTVKNAPRTLDLDLLDLGGRIADGPIALPHPRLHERAFVLGPLCEIAPDWVHPRLGLTARALLAGLG